MQREATAMTVRQNLGELLNEVQYKHDEIVITKAGKPVAAIIDMVAYEQIRRKNNGEFERLWAEYSKGFDDLTEDQQMQLATEMVAEVRAERKAAAKTPAT
jgi:prevent-host-death family protein